MPRSTVTKVHGPRHQHHLFDVSLPLRYLSDDGLCAIDINHKRDMAGTLGDESSDWTISEKAANVLDECVENKETGGVTMDLSKSRPSRRNI